MPEAGEILDGRYEVLDLLGEGGMGTVYRAQDRQLDRMVAIKVVHPDLMGRKGPQITASIRRRFELEAKSVARLNHPHICTVHDIGCAGNADYFVMEYLAGES